MHKACITYGEAVKRGDLKGRSHLGDLGVDRMIMSKLILDKSDVRVWIFRIRSSGRLDDEL